MAPEGLPEQVTKGNTMQTPAGAKQRDPEARGCLKPVRKPPGRVWEAWPSPSKDADSAGRLTTAA